MTPLLSKKIFFHFPYPSFSLKNRRQLQLFIENILIKENKKTERVNFIFCRDKELLRLNRQHLGHNYYTDILTFSLAQKEKPLVADIYISPEEVLANSKRFETTFTQEIHRVIFHGILHLCGYGDKTPKEIATMRSLEDHYLKDYFRFVPRETSRGE
jgi:probable rRNA maturation factor